MIHVILRLSESITYHFSKQTLSEKGYATALLTGKNSIKSLHHL